VDNFDCALSVLSTNPGWYGLQGSGYSAKVWVEKAAKG